MGVEVGKWVSESKCIEKVGVLYRPGSPQSGHLAEEITRQLEAWELRPWVASVQEKREELEARLGELDLLITLGGDGTILRAARMAASHRVPILGINLGRLGFLAELEPEDWREGLEQVMEGNFWLEERMMLRVELWRGGKMLNSCDALNEAVIGRGSPPRMVHLATYIDGHYLTTYVADGVIVATATGSTAYALAAGGPILSPEMKDILLIPLAPHLNLDRALILPPTVTVRVEATAGDRAELSVDGQALASLEENDCAQTRASPHSCLFARTREPAYFFLTLMDRLRRGY
ncbi:MAG: NAD(+)/NADH kinase [Anaerolineae bacterium]